MTIEKYRAWDKEKNRMCDVTQINLSDKFVNIVYVNKLNCEEIADFDILFSKVELMECLGVKDKKGKEIWEGDIVKWTYPDIDDEYYKEMSVFGSIFGAVYWNNKDCSFNIKQISKDIFKFNKNDTHEDDNDLIFYDYDGKEFEWEWLEVVGNIYENKEFYENKLSKYKLGS